MLWTGDKPGSKAIEENMTSYFNTLQGFLLLSHGGTVGAGPTLSSIIHESVKQVVDSSFRLIKETVSAYGKLFRFLSQTHPHPVNTQFLWTFNNYLKRYSLETRY